MENPVHRLKHVSRKLDELVSSLTFNLIARNYEAVSLDTSAIATAVADLQTIATEIGTGDQAAIAAAVAAAQESDQAALNAAVAPLQAEIAALKAQLAPPPAGLTVGTPTVTISVGSSGPTAVSVTGGTGAITASGLPAGITWDGSANLVADGTEVAGTSTVTFTDSSTPPLSGTLSLTVA